MRPGKPGWKLWTRRLPRARLSVSPDTWALLAITVAVLLANLPYLLGFFDPNPLDFRSGLTSAITHGWLSGKPTIDPSNGFTSQAIGHLAALDVLHLHLPWWNPYEGTGMALLGETQAAALFPPTLLTAFSGGQLYEHVLLELIAGICTYRLLRRIRVTRAAAIAGAIAYALNGKFAWFADASVNPLPFLPMLLLGIERAYAATRAGRSRRLAADRARRRPVGLRGLPRGRLHRHPDGRGLGRLALWLPGAPAAPVVRRQGRAGSRGRHAAGGPDAGGHGRLPEPCRSRRPYGSAARTSASCPLCGAATPDAVRLRPGQLQPSSVPSGSWWVAICRPRSLLFAVLAVLAPGRRGLKAVLLGWTLLVFARMYGAPPLLGHVLGVLPGMSEIQFYRYGTAALELPVIVLAALGLDDLIARAGTPAPTALGRPGGDRRRHRGCALRPARRPLAGDGLSP